MSKKNEIAENAFIDATKKMVSSGITNILKDLYADWGPKYYEVEGAHEELLRLIKELAPVEKAVYGISEDGETINE